MIPLVCLEPMQASVGVRILKRAAAVLAGVAAWGALAAPSFAGCSRPILVPASPLGQMMIVHSDTGRVEGVYPELLRDIGKAVGCTFEFRIVEPRVRAEMLVASGEMDVFVGAVRNPERDVWGRFVPLMEVEWKLVSHSPSRPPPATVGELLAMNGIVFDAVRGYNYGAAYRDLLNALDERHALDLVADPQTVVRKMQMGRADFSLMPPGTLDGALDAAEASIEFRKRVRLSHLAGLPHGVTGVYLSGSLKAEDAALLRQVLTQAARDGALLTRVHQALPAADAASYGALPASSAH